MPNWCSNSIVVNGKGKNVKQFILDNFKTHRFSEGDFAYILDFEQFDPTPLDENGEVFSEWYNWRLNHWGCKWSPCAEQTVSLTIEDKEGNFETCYDYHSKEIFSEELINKLDEESDMKLELHCYCETPWGPPEGIFKQWYEKYKEMEIEASLKFYEPGCCVLGELWFSGGETDDEYYEEIIDDHDRKEWILYLLKEGWESIDWYIEECYDMIHEMHPEEMADKIFDKVKEMLGVCKLEEAATLINDIYVNYNESLSKGDGNESSKE